MSETTVTAGIHLAAFERPTIECTTGETASRPDGYPVLRIGPAAIWPTVEQLRAIRAAVDAWLAGPDGVRLSGPRRPDAIC